MASISASKACLYYQLGYCRFGDLCRYSHEDDFDDSLEGVSLTSYQHRKGVSFALAGKFVFMQDVDSALSNLARRTSEESWTTEKSISEHDQLLAYLNSLLIGIQLLNSSKTITHDLRGRTIISTGLYDLCNGTEEEIFMVLAANETKKQRYFFVEWATMNEIGSANLPKGLSFSFHRTLTTFNPKLEVIPNFEHIVVHNERRLRQDPKYSKMNKEKFGKTVREDIMATLRQLKLNPSHKGLAPPVVPFYCFSHKTIQFLTPISGTSSVLILCYQTYHGRKQYYAVTVLTMEMAYTNARLLGRVDTPWLKKIMKIKDEKMTTI